MNDYVSIKAVSKPKEEYWQKKKKKADCAATMYELANDLHEIWRKYGKEGTVF